MKLTKVGVLMLGTQDMAKAVAFYRDQLGMTVQAQHEGFTFLDGGGLTLALSTAHARISEHIAGATEVVFSVESVKQAHAELKAQGVEFQNEPRPVTGPMWAANFKDPDGHRLSIFGPE